jgi:murein DD-endopeptidase MepM/ murein hydrolase activator NlpD
VTFAGRPALRGMGRRTKLTCVAGLGLSLAAIPATAVGSTGGIVAGSPARITGVSCVKSCVSADEAQAGSIVRLRGHELQNTGRVVFLGRTGDADNVSAGVRRRDARPAYVDVKVPAAARSGPVLALERSDGSTSLQSPGGITVDHGVDPRGAGSIRGNGVVAKLESRTVYFAGKRGQRLAYSLTGSQAVPVRVDLVKVADGSVVQSWSPGAVNPGATQTIEWKGSPNVGDSRFQFQVFTGSAATSPAAPPTATAGARSAQTGAPSVAGSFMYLQHIFPIRGAHNYGTAENRYGAPRSGHSHAGQDVLAACGTPLVAARGGKVVEAGYEGAGGNAVVIHGTGSNFDNVYMHLRDAPLVHNGQRVYTGQLIGFVGETGDASVCHLHFEVWQGAWWNGGHTIDPLPSLKAWDALS